VSFNARRGCEFKKWRFEKRSFKRRELVYRHLFDERLRVKFVIEAIYLLNLFCWTMKNVFSELQKRVLLMIF